jgi:hypothetical protein
MISRSAKSPSPASLLDELQSTLAHGTVARRLETLRRVTDLFINGANDYSDEQVGLFDDVFQALIDHIETSAKMLLSNRLAPIDTAPPLTIRALAFDDIIEVAGPVLSQSMRLDDKTLIENARSKSQAHLMAISTRKTLSGAVTGDRHRRRISTPARSSSPLASQLASQGSSSGGQLARHTDGRIPSPLDSAQFEALDWGLPPTSEKSRIAGTPLYMAPEIWRGGRRMERSSIWGASTTR